MRNPHVRFDEGRGSRAEALLLSYSTATLCGQSLLGKPGLVAPFLDVEWNEDIHVNGYQPSPGEEPLVYFDWITDGYFATLRTPLLAGRNSTLAILDDFGILFNILHRTRMNRGRGRRQLTAGPGERIAP